MENKRKEIYERLHEAVCDTPLTELPLKLPKGNRILVKEEFRNPTGSHYDRVYIQLLHDLELQGKIIPGVTPLIETTSGSAGESFAWVCQELGYSATIIAPESAPPKKLNAMRKLGAELVFSDPKKYVTGAASKLKLYLTTINRKRKKDGVPTYFCPNHSREESTLVGLERIAQESLKQANMPIDYFIAALGNGSSILGPGRYFAEHSPETIIIGWEPVETGVATEMKTPGEYNFLFGIRPGKLRHVLHGTGPGNEIHFPFLENAIKGNDDLPPVVDAVRMTRSDDTEEKIRQIIDPDGSACISSLSIGGGGNRNMTRAIQHILNTRHFPNWQDIARDFAEEGYEGGRTTAASVAVAIDIMTEKEFKFSKKFPFFNMESVSDKTFLVIGYDLMSKYN